MNNYILSHRAKIIDRYYVYLHIRKSDGRVFYVGKGCGSRAWQTRGRSKYWENIALKSEYCIKIVAHKLPEHESLFLERKLIIEFKDSICNLTSGGDSPKFSKETLEKLSKARLGKKHSSEHCSNISKSKLGVKRQYFNGSGNPNFDDNTYSFRNKVTNELFQGTRHDFCSFYNLSASLLKGLFLNNPRKSSQGWLLERTK